MRHIAISFKSFYLFLQLQSNLMRRCFFLLLFAFGLTANAQTSTSFLERAKKYIDSLTTALPRAKPHTRVEILYHLGWAYSVINDDDTSWTFFKQALKEATNIQDRRGIAITLTHMGYYEAGHSNYEKAKSYAQQAIAIVKNSEDVSTARPFLLLMNLHRNLSEFSELLVVADAAEPIIRKQKNDNELANLYSLKARAYEALNKTYEQLHSLNESVYLNKKIGNKSDLSDALAEIGTVYYNMHEYNTALGYYRQSLNYASPNSVRNNYYFAYHKLGNVHMEMQQYDSALYCYNRALTILKDRTKDAKENKPYVLSTEIKVGEVYLKMGNNNKALEYFLPFLDYFRKKGDVNKIVQVLPKIARAYLQKGEYAVALNHSRELLQLCAKNKTAKAYRYAYDLLATLFEKTNRVDSAYYYLQLASALRDTVDQSNYKNNVTFFKTMMENKDKEARIELLNKNNQLKQQELDLLNIKLENEAAASQIDLLHKNNELLNKDNQLKQQKLNLLNATVENEAATSKIKLLNKNNELLNKNNELLNKDNQLKKQKLNLLIGGLICLFVLAVVFMGYLNVKRKNEAHRRVLVENELQIQKLESEKKQASLQHHASELEMQALRSQMNPHFIFNCLNAINHFILNNEEETASDYLTKFSRLIRLVLQNSSKKTISLADELATLQLYIELEQVRFTSRFHFSICVDEEIDTEGLMMPPMLLQPFVENAIWHGLMHKESTGELTIDISQQGERLRCIITDNGVGRQAATNNKNHLALKKSMGMQITANRLKMLHTDKESGSFTIIDLKDEKGNNSGTKVILTIPAKLNETVTA